MRIINFDNLCALRCIVVGIAHNNYIENKEHYNEYKQIINSRENLKNSRLKPKDWLKYYKSIQQECARLLKLRKLKNI